jgi:hypothetical protein
MPWLSVAAGACASLPLPETPLGVETGVHGDIRVVWGNSLRGQICQVPARGSRLLLGGLLGGRQEPRPSTARVVNARPVLPAPHPPADLSSENLGSQIQQQKFGRGLQRASSKGPSPRLLSIFYHALTADSRRIYRCLWYSSGLNTSRTERPPPSQETGLTVLRFSVLCQDRDSLGPLPFLLLAADYDAHKRSWCPWPAWGSLSASRPRW